jgi:molybdenum cofactor cytidylyltransferase
VKLSNALRIQPGEALAFTGAGGKTSAMRRVAKEWSPHRPVLLTTTTRLGLDQINLAPIHIPAVSMDALPAVKGALREPGAVLLTGPSAGGEAKWLAPPMELLTAAVEAACQAGGIALLEADGARGRAFKVPAEHEPVVPPFVQRLVPVLGLEALGTPVDGERVHRPERVMALLGMRAGEIIGEDHLAAWLTSPQGGLKGAPPGAKIRALLNVGEHPDGMEAGRRIGQSALSEPLLEAVIVGHPAREPLVSEVIGRVAGVVLAAGGAARMGSIKQLELWRGRPLVWHAAQAGLAAGLDPLIVVLGAAAGQVRMALSGLPVDRVINPGWEAGQSTSVRAGVAALDATVEAVVFLLADMPLVGPELIGRLIEGHRQSLMAIVAPRAAGRLANPVLFDRRTFSSLSVLAGDQGGRGLYAHFPVLAIEADEASLIDIDTPEDWRRIGASE